MNSLLKPQKLWYRLHSSKSCLTDLSNEIKTASYIRSSPRYGPNEFGAALGLAKRVRFAGQSPARDRIRVKVRKFNRQMKREIRFFTFFVQPDGADPKLRPGRIGARTGRKKFNVIR